MVVKREESILVVDNNPTSLSVLVDFLTREGFDIHVAEDGKSALEVLDYIEPDFILLDVLMPRSRATSRVERRYTCRRSTAPIRFRFREVSRLRSSHSMKLSRSL